MRTMQEQLARELGKLIHHAHLLSCCGNPSPNQAAAFERSSNPQPGDWVVETSTFYRHGGPVVGRLMTTREEPGGDATWDVERDGPRPLVRFWYIELPDGTRARWCNANFVASSSPPRSDEAHDAEWLTEALRRHGL